MSARPDIAGHDNVVVSVLASADTSLQPADVVYLTTGLDIAWVSDSVAAVLGWEPWELVGTPAVDLVSPNQDRSWIDANRHRLLAGQEVVQRLLMRRKDGGERWFSGVAHPVSQGSPQEGFVVVLRQMDDEDREDASEDALRAAARDDVTGVDSRQAILAHLDRLLSAAPHSACVMMVEFENLHLVNQSLGQDSGDVALTEFARRLQSVAAQDECVGRVSGKSFLVCCPGVAESDALRTKAQRLVSGLGDDIVVAGRRIQPVVLAAVASSRAGSTSLTVLRDADVALAHAREARDGAIAVFDEEMSDRAVRRFVLQDELRYGIDADELDLFFQPVVSLTDGQMVAVESLLRWHHPREGLLAPPSFMAVAEESGLIRTIGTRVLEKACAALQQLPPHALQVGVNVSGVELSDPTWLDRVIDVFERTQVDPDCLVLELTETAVIAARRELASDLRALRDLGVGIFLDDFGTGYSSLSMIRDLPISGIKLDKSFSTLVEQGDPSGVALAQGLAQLIRPLGLVGVAEGIESHDLGARLGELGWQFGQGYAFGRPGPFTLLPEVPARPPAGPHH